MEELERNSKSIINFCWIFIIIGLIEIFGLILITTNFLAIIPGLITIIPAYNSLSKIDKKRRYFVGIWSLLKYNPISLALIAFILGDFYGPYNNNSGIFLVFFILYLVIGVLSVIFGIIILVKIAKHNKLIKLKIDLN